VLTLHWGFSLSVRGSCGGGGRWKGAGSRGK